jgi:hypothetical protein
MNATLFYAGSIAFALPYLVIVAILLHNSLRRARRRRGKGRRPAPSTVCSTSAALGAMLLFAQIFYRPSMVHAVEAREHVDVDEDDSGDPEHPDKSLRRQLKRIRRGEPVGDLAVRL